MTAAFLRSARMVCVMPSRPMWTVAGCVVHAKSEGRALTTKIASLRPAELPGVLIQTPPRPNVASTMIARVEFVKEEYVNLPRVKMASETETKQERTAAAIAGDAPCFRVVWSTRTVRLDSAFKVVVGRPLVGTESLIRAKPVTMGISGTGITAPRIASK